MKITDVTLTIFTWDGIPATVYHQGSLASSRSAIWGCCASSRTRGWRGMPSWVRRAIRLRWTDRS